MAQIKTAYGYRLFAEPSPLCIPQNPDLAAAFAVRADHAADEAMLCGRVAQAERLAHAAYEARCRATGASA